MFTCLMKLLRPLSGQPESLFPAEDLSNLSADGFELSLTPGARVRLQICVDLPPGFRVTALFAGIRGARAEQNGQIRPDRRTCRQLSTLERVNRVHNGSGDRCG